MVRTDGVRSGYDDFNDLNITWTNSESTLENGAKIAYPELDDILPRDMSLIDNAFENSSIEDLLINAVQCFRDEQRCIFCHVFVLNDLLDLKVLCFVSEPFRKCKKNPPFGFVCHISLFKAVLVILPRQAIVLKIDERCFPDIWHELEIVDHPIFVLAHDTRPKNIIKLLENIARTQAIDVIALTIKRDRFSIFVAHASTDEYCILAPVTGFGVDVLSTSLGHLSNVRPFKKGDDLLASIKLNRLFFDELLFTTYVGGKRP